jgi:hypothetical protein
MKNFISIILLLLAGLTTAYGMDNKSGDSEKVLMEIDKTKINWTTDIERSMDYAIIEACLYPSQGLVEVTLHNIGNASVSLINSNNQVVSSDYVQTDMLTTVYLYTFSSSGTYYLKVISDTWYADGTATF